MGEEKGQGGEVAREEKMQAILQAVIRCAGKVRWPRSTAGTSLKIGLKGGPQEGGRFKEQ